MVVELRRLGLAGTRWAAAQADTIRAQLLTIGGLVRGSVRRLTLALTSGYPWKEDFAAVWARLQSAWEP